MLKERDMSAEVLRKAATLMRERAEAAADCFPAPWTTQREGQWEWSVRDAEGTEITWTMPTYIASWHPAVALAIADWLDATAAEHESDSGNPTVDNFFTSFDTALDHAALAVARAYLGEE